jgi:predicted dienelactone hydrolase
VRPLRSSAALLLALAACSTPAAPPADASPADVSPASDVPTAPSDASTAPDVPFEDAAPPGMPLSWDVRQMGPYAAGYRAIQFAYTPRGASAPRNLTFHIWYPTHTTTGAHPRYANVIYDTNATIGAPLSPSAYGPRYPVHVYSHGDRGFGGTSHFLMTYFASHGWVCIAPDHALNTIRDTPDPRPISLYYLRGQDVSAALDALEQLPATDPLAGRVDTTHALLSGHSFGTHTVWSAVGATFDLDLITARCPSDPTCSDADLNAFRLAAGDPRFVAGIPMAGAISRDFFGPDGHTSVTVPLFAMSGSDDPVGDDVQFTSTAPLPLTWIDVRGGCHQFFALGGCDNIADSFQPVIVGAYALAFGRRYVLNDTDPTVTGLLDGSVAVSDLVTFHRR